MNQKVESYLNYTVTRCWNSASMSAKKLRLKSVDNEMNKEKKNCARLCRLNKFTVMSVKGKVFTRFFEIPII